MSRAAVQLTMPSRDIFVTQIRQADGSLKPVISSQALGDQSIRINKRDNMSALQLLMGLCLQCSVAQEDLQTPLMRLMSCVIAYRGIPINLWKEILGFNIGLSQYDSNSLATTGNYALAIHRPTLFPKIAMDPEIVVDAAMRGQEDIVLNILRADPSYLTKLAEVENSVGVKSIRTPLQAAIMANDVQLIERIKEHFERIPNGLTIMYGQMLEIYKESLRAYYDKQQALVEELTVLKTNGTATPTDLAALELAEARAACYLQALQNNGNSNYDDPNYLNVIISAHDQAQVDNTFDFQPYIKAICDIDFNDPLQNQQLDDVTALIYANTPDETAAVIARTGVSAKQTDEARTKSFDQLTLVGKLNRFREESVALMQREVIFNPNHILEGLKQNDRIWHEFDDPPVGEDPSYQKRRVIFCQLVGWTQRCASEPVKQDIRQGTGYLTEKNEPRCRQSRFNNSGGPRNDDYTRNDYTDVSLLDSSVIDGVGYKFADSGIFTGRQRVSRGGGPYQLVSFFEKLCRAKTASFNNLLRSLCEHAPESLSVVVR